MKATTSISTLRAELAAKRMVRQRNKRLEAELASFATPAERQELEAILSRHTAEEIAELEAMINRPLLTR
jgi:hypothetical protein